MIFFIFRELSAKSAVSGPCPLNSFMYTLKLPQKNYAKESTQGTTAQPGYYPAGFGMRFSKVNCQCWRDPQAKR